MNMRILREAYDNQVQFWVVNSDQMVLDGPFDTAAQAANSMRLILQACL